MGDQINTLRQWNLTAVALEPDMDQEKIKMVKQGCFNFVFSSPETALKPFWKDVFMSNTWREKSLALVIDEAHCISEWGENFRKEFKHLHELRSAIRAPVLALTATSTNAVKADILKCLQIEDAHIVHRSPDRPNIFIDFQKAESTEIEKKCEWIVNHLRENNSAAKKIIIYCRSIDRVSQVFILLRSCLGIDAYANRIKDSNHALIDMFHSSIHENSKPEILRLFQDPNSNLSCLVATVALAMGIQIDDVDIVMHLGSPKTVLSYWQEAGRCARDGRPGYSYVLYDNFTLSGKGTSKDLKKIVEDSGCFRQNILRYLGDNEFTNDSEICEGHCGTDRCLCTKCMCCSSCRGSCLCNISNKFSVIKFAQITDDPTDTLN
ncbi:ATP-dependent DNA helicase RecQ-like [Pecten maximus]|uniref:ATP-dependent DNA helicase RecQ-like n=1 Tax=Pecten maximus TaxID=6579 RepID=UPI0014588AA6|nr:ATP-dependent DNA helicase RecQ-like [Pecten maximus]